MATTKDSERTLRLKAALRDNLKRRKDQARGRAGAADRKDEGRRDDPGVPPPTTCET